MAKKNIPAIVSATGLMASFATELIREVRAHGGSNEDAYRGLADQDLVKQFAELLVGKSSVNVFQITCEGSHKTSELVRMGNYDRVSDWITDERFPVQKHASVSRSIELVEFDHDPTSEEVLAEFSRRGLNRPTHEDALYFGVKHPEEQRKRPIVFLHEPGQFPGGSRRVLVLGGGARKRGLDLYWLVGRWGRRCAFAGVRK